MATAKRQHKKPVDYHFCKICKRNHMEGRKHIYSKKHKAKLGSVLTNFGSKISEARSLLSKARVVDGELEPGRKMWCYCCELEINKHITDGHTSIKYGGLLEHMASSDHHKKTRHFWWENGAENSKLQSFIVYEAELDKFKKSVEKEMDKLDSQREKRTKELAEEIKQTDIHRAQIAAGTGANELPSSSSFIPTTVPQPLFPSLSTQSTAQPDTIIYHSKRNVHTGATPPWLLEDDSNGGCGSSNHGNDAVIFGPSEDQFIQWKEKHGKTKKNPKRVGADFHQNLRRLGLLDKHDDDWLPNFGRVWNSGPRSHTKKEFRNELSVKTSTKRPSLDHTSPSTTSSFDNISSSIPTLFYTPPLTTPSSCTPGPMATPSSLPSDISIQPYVRRRPLKRSHPPDDNDSSN